MKKIYIDVFPVSTPHVGLGEFCWQMGQHLADRAEELRANYGIEICFILPPQHKGCFGKNVKYYGLRPSFRKVSFLFPLHADLIHIPYQFSRLKQLPMVKKRLLTVHDINFMYEKTGSRRQRSMKSFKKKIQNADYISYISKFAKKDTERHFKVKMPSRVIYNGTTDLSPIANPENLRPNLPKNFLFHISSLQPKKNAHLLVEMMEHLPNETLVIAGDWSTKYGENLLQKIKNTPHGNIIALSDVSNAEKAALFQACKALLFPSLCEGFGLPPIEAMKMGKPVFLSTLTSLPEIGGKEAFYWKDLNPKAMAEFVNEKIEFLASHPEYSAKLQENANRFIWEQCVDEYINYYLEILKIKK